MQSDSGASAGPGPVTGREPPPPQAKRTRAGAAWVGISIAALVLILLIVFIAQNTHKREDLVPVARRPLPAGAGPAGGRSGGRLVAIVAGSTRILQLRREGRRRRRA